MTTANIPSLGAVAGKARELINNGYASATLVATTMILANSVDNSALVVHDNDPFVRQAELALPSALVAPDFTQNQDLSTAAQIGLSVAGIEAARTTTSLKGIVATGAAAQLASCGADAAIERSGALGTVNHIERDLGFSAIYTALFTKFILDRAKDRQNNRRAWLGGAVALAGVLVAGPLVLENAQTGVLDASSHAAGILVGSLAHKLDSREQIASN